jgi:HSP20 family molecular chaperone IbpA
MTTMETIRRRVEMLPLASMEKTIGSTGKPMPLPVINVDETDEEYIIYMSMPGMRLRRSLRLRLLRVEPFIPIA